MKNLFTIDKLDKSGHAVSIPDGDLGLGWLYYALVRIYKPQVAVVIGSWRGFVPIVMAGAMRDNGPDANGSDGVVVFIDPGLIDDFWHDPQVVDRYFAGYGVDKHIVHYKMTTQEFARSHSYPDLGKIGMLFVDGLHTADQASFDHEVFMPKLDGPVLFHDSQSDLTCTLYGKQHEYKHSVKDYVRQLRERGFSVLDIARGQGVAVVLPPVGKSQR